MRFLIHFSYDGSYFHGYQTQPGYRTIQEELENAATKINNGEKVKVVASGRTDKKVHAYHQVAHLDMNVSINPKQVKRAMNRYLPSDIHVFETEEVSSDFHARYYVISKTYEYHLNMGEYNPIRRNYCYQHNYKLDIEAMKKAITYFIGTHDFRAFVTENSIKDNCVRTITNASITLDDYYKDITYITDYPDIINYELQKKTLTKTN
jgi:tRNA pseudouridine38-40 synthase